MKKLTDTIIKYYKRLLLSSLFLGLLAVFLTAKLGIMSDLDDMLPTEHEIFQATQAFEAYFPSQDQGIIYLSGDKDVAIHAMTSIERKLKGNQWINDITYRVDLSSLGSKSLLYLSLNDIENLDMTSMNKEPFKYISNDKEDGFLMMIRPEIKGDFVQARSNFYESIQTVIRDVEEDYPTLSIHFTGGALIQDHEADTIAFDNLLPKVALTIALVIGLVIITFRRLLLPMVIIYPLLLGALCASAIAYLIYGSLNMFSVSFAMLLVGLGVDFGVHILSRVLEENKSHSLESSIKISIQSTGSSILLGGITTAVAFFTFIFADFQAFSQMGIISGIGILLLVGLMLSLLPAIFILFKKQIRMKPPIVFKWLENLIRFSLTHSKLILMTLVLLCIFVLPNVRNFSVIGDMNKIYPENIPSRQIAPVIERDFDYKLDTLSFMIEDDGKLYEYMDQFNSSPYVEKVVTIYDYIPLNQDEKIQLIKKLYGIALEPIVIDDLPLEIKDKYFNKNMFLVELLPKGNIYDPETYESIKALVYKISGNYPLGMAPLMNEIIAIVQNDIIRISLVCLSFVFLMLLIMFKKIGLSIFTMIPVVGSIYLTIGLLPLFDRDINIFSVAAFPLIIGIGIDSGIHLMHRLKENKEDIGALTQTSQAIFLTSTTTVVGFGSLSMINHPGMSNLGFTVSLGMLICFVLTILVIPIGRKLLP